MSERTNPYICGKCHSDRLYREDDRLNGGVFIACQLCGNRYPGGKEPVMGTDSKSVPKVSNRVGKPEVIPASSPVIPAEAGIQETTPVTKEGKTVSNTHSDEPALKNKLMDLNNYLFAQMARLSDGQLEPEKLKGEIERAKAMSNIARDIIGNAQLALNAARVMKGEGIIPKAMPKMLGMNDVIDGGV